MTILPAARAELEAAGYTPRTDADARRDAALMLGAGEDSREVQVFLFGESDLVHA